MTASSPASSPTSQRHSVESLTRTLNNVNTLVTRGEGKLNLLQGQVADVEERRSLAESLQETLSQASTVLQELEQAWRRSFESRLSSVVSDGLTAVFGEDIKLRVESTTKRDATSMKLILVQNGIEIEDPAEGTGGSVVTVLDVLLKILLLVSAPHLRRFIVLDESFRMVEARHLPALGQLLRELSQRLGLQVIMVSHETEMVDIADVVYSVENGGVKLIKSGREERD